MTHDALAFSGNSIAEDRLRTKFRWLAHVNGLFCAALAFFCYQGSAEASLPEIRFSAKSLEYETVHMRDVHARLASDGAFEIVAGHTAMGESNPDFTDISVTGNVLEFTSGRGETYFFAGLQAGVFSLVLEVNQGPEATLAVLTLKDQDMLEFRVWPLLPSQWDWLHSGRLDAELRYRAAGDAPPDITLEFSASGLGFDSPEGRFAGESLALEVEVKAPGNQWASPVVRGSLTSGELLLGDFYRNFANDELQFAFNPSWNSESLQIRSFSLSDRDSLSVEGKAGFDLGESEQPWYLQISRLELDFPGAYDRYIEPMAATLTLDGLGVTGHVSWSGEWEGGDFTSGDLTVSDLSIVDTRRSRFAFTGLDARMRPGDHSFDSRLNWRGLLIGRINLGPGELALDSEPGKFAIVRPLVLDVLGGRLVLSEFSVLLPGGAENAGGEPDIRLKADIDNLDMKQLTLAFGWPEFSGKISGHIPGVSLNEGVLEVEGKILFSVFDGMLSLENLRVERAFGVLPSLAANVEAVGLDLEQVTRTFSFGQISGRVDGYIRDLRMLDWKPVAFDAWFGTPEGQKGSRDISRRAVNHLTTLGGGRATTALTNPVMKLFNNFSYKELGLGCRMQNNVCDIRGVSEDDVSVLIMEGAGVPKITIRAFNRRVDWPQLMAQLLAASEGESVKIGD